MTLKLRWAAARGCRGAEAQLRRWAAARDRWGVRSGTGLCDGGERSLDLGSRRAQTGGKRCADGGRQAGGRDTLRAPSAPQLGAARCGLKGERAAGGRAAGGRAADARTPSGKRRCCLRTTAQAPPRPEEKNPTRCEGPTPAREHEGEGKAGRPPTAQWPGPTAPSRWLRERGAAIPETPGHATPRSRCARSASFLGHADNTGWARVGGSSTSDPR